jgi:hypothetical protein
MLPSEKARSSIRWTPLARVFGMIVPHAPAKAIAAAPFVVVRRVTTLVPPAPSFRSTRR